MRVALGVTGGVAAYKAAELVRRLQQGACPASQHRSHCRPVIPREGYVTEVITFRIVNGVHRVQSGHFLGSDHADPAESGNRASHLTFQRLQGVDEF